ncbi:MAG: hypothetical protein ACRD3Q_06500, partial [Terriglobales bacterium]
RKSTGPKTPVGKRYSSRNSLKHGFYSNELPVSDAERPEFETLRRQLRRQFKPTTPMQSLAYEAIAAAAWRARIAIRLESRLCASQLQDGQPSASASDDAIVDPHLSRWFGSSRLELRRGIKDLLYARGEFVALSRLREETQEFVSRGFGPEILDLLTHFTPMHKQAIDLTKLLVSQLENFDMPLPGSNLSPAQLPEIVQDPHQASEMVLKLFDMYRHVLEDMLKLKDQHWSDGAPRGTCSRSDFNPQFVAGANRELRRAVDWFLHLQEVGL